MFGYSAAKESIPPVPPAYSAICGNTTLTAPSGLGLQGRMRLGPTRRRGQFSMIFGSLRVDNGFGFRAAILPIRPAHTALRQLATRVPVRQRMFRVRAGVPRAGAMPTAISGSMVAGDMVLLTQTRPDS